MTSYTHFLWINAYRILNGVPLYLLYEGRRGGFVSKQKEVIRAESLPELELLMDIHKIPTETVACGPYRLRDLIDVCNRNKRISLELLLFFMYS